MIVVVHVVLEPIVNDDSNDSDSSVTPRPQLGADVAVEVRDVSLADAPASTVGAARTTISGQLSSWLATTEVEVDGADLGSSLQCWVRVSEDLTRDLDAGDWITMQSVPVDGALDEQFVQAPVRRIG